MSVGATGRGYANRARNPGIANLLSGVGLAALAAALSASPAMAQNWTGTTSNDWTVRNELGRRIGSGCRLGRH